jgi:hypothetical protein
MLLTNLIRGLLLSFKVLTTESVCSRCVEVKYKVDEIRARVAFQRDIRDCNILCFTETWLAWDMLSESVQEQWGFSAHRTDRNKHLSGKKKAEEYVS